MILPNLLYILREPEFRVSLMQKNLGSTFILWVKQPNFLELKNSQTSDSLHMIQKKIKTYNLGKLTYMYLLGGISTLHINF